MTRRRVENDSKKDILSKVHRRVVDELLKREGPAVPGKGLEKIALADQNLRKAVAELFITLEELGNAEIAVDLLSDHAAMLVEMINRYKGSS